MSKTQVLKEETTLDIMNPFEPVDTTWLDTTLANGSTLKEALKTGLNRVTKEDEGEVFQKWNNFIAQVHKAVPQISVHLTIRKTKKGIKYYGVDKELWDALKSDGESSIDGLPAL